MRNAAASWCAEVFFWVAGGAFVIVLLVFRSPALDYRAVMAGAVLPLIDLLAGDVRLAHTLLAPVAVLGIVMLATQRRRLVRRRWLGIPIGMFLHLVLDGVWSNAGLFWWPAFGTGFDAVPAPELSRGVPLDLAMEVVGAAALVWAYRRFRLNEAARRDRFVRTGMLSRDLMPGPEAGM